VITFIRALVMFVHLHAMSKDFLIRQLEALQKFMVELNEAEYRDLVGCTAGFHDSAFDLVSAARHLEDIESALVAVRDIVRDLRTGSYVAIQP